MDEQQASIDRTGLISLLAWLGKGIAILLFLLLVIGLWLTSYAAGAILLVSFALGGLLLWMTLVERRIARRDGVKAWLVFLVTLLLVLIVLSSEELDFTGTVAPPLTALFEAETHTVTIEPVDETLEAFQISEEITLEGADILSVEPTTFFRDQAVESTRRGLILREVDTDLTAQRIDLSFNNGSRLGGDFWQRLTITFTNGTSLPTRIRHVSPQVELRDLPRDSFYAAKNAEDVAVYPYIDVETVTWSSVSPRQRLSFAFLPPPYHHLHTVLTPFMRISSLPEVLVALSGVIAATIITPIIKPVLVELAKDKLKTRLEKEAEKPEKKTRTIIVSGSGEEKEIEVED